MSGDASALRVQCHPQAPEIEGAPKCKPLDNLQYSPTYPYALIEPGAIILAALSIRLEL